MSVAIAYKNPRRPGEIGLVLVCEQPQVAATRENLERRGFVVVEATPPSRSIFSPSRR
jgi:hypothetical protein